MESLNTLAVDAGLMALLPVSATSTNSVPSYTQEVTLNGDYACWTVTEALPNWGVRVKRLLISRKSQEELAADLTETEKLEEIAPLSVASPTQYIFSDPSYVCSSEQFMEFCMEREGEEYPTRQAWAGGVCVSSGFGDGAYSLDAATDDDGVVSDAVVVFFTDEPHPAPAEIVMDISMRLADDSDYEVYWTPLLNQLLDHLHNTPVTERVALREVLEICNEPYHPDSPDFPLKVSRIGTIAYEALETEPSTGNFAGLTEAEATEFLGWMDQKVKKVLEEVGDPDWSLVRDCHPEVLEAQNVTAVFEGIMDRDRVKTLLSAVSKIKETLSSEEIVEVEAEKDFDDFIEDWGAVQYPDQDGVYHWEDRTEALAAADGDIERIWTIVSGCDTPDRDTDWVVPGMAVVNRLNYIVAERPRPADFDESGRTHCVEYLWHDYGEEQ